MPDSSPDPQPAGMRLDADEFELSTLLPYVIVRTGAALDHAFTATMATIGLTARHFGILSQFTNGRRPTAAAIARTLGITPQAVGPQIEQLRQRGLLDSIPRRGRGSPHELSLTSRGNETLRDALTLARREQRRVLTDLDEPQRQAMLGQLRNISKRAAEHPKAGLLPPGPRPPR